MTMHSIHSQAGGPSAARRERGVVLIIALVMLVVISLLATFSIRSAMSTESVSGNVRTTQMASQAAEIALRYCEDAVVANTRAPTPVVPPAALSPSGIVIQAAASSPLGISTTVWDTTRTGVFVLPTTVVNGTVTYKRMPECIAEQVSAVNATNTGLTTTSTYLITARGFGPEVASCNSAAAPPAAGACSRPDGSEVWLQSTLEAQ